MSHTTVIAGTGIASVRVAQALRRAGYDGRLQMLGDEADLPYDKPPLSKGLLAGTLPEEKIRLMTAEQAEELRIELMLGVPAARLDVAARQVLRADSTAVPYDALVIATGARPRPSPWPVASGVHVLRSLSDCQALRRDLADGGPVAVIGAGFIGSEVASTCRSLGIDVTLIDPQPVPMARLVGDDAGQLMSELHRRHGTSTRFGAGVEDITGERGDLTVRLTDGSTVSCAIAVAGIGTVPNDDWLENSGLVIDDGVVCDRYGRTSAPSVYAVGDVARWQHHQDAGHVRAEHWTNAVDQARCLAHTMMFPAEPSAHTPAHFIWSDQYDWSIHMIGETAPGAEHVVVQRNADGNHRFAAVFAAGAELRGGMSVNWPKASIILRKAIRAGAAFTETLHSIEAQR